MSQDLTREIVGFVSRQGWRYRLTDEYVELSCPVGCGGQRNPFAIHKGTGGGSCRKCGWRGGLDALKRMVGEKPEGNLLPAAPPPKPKTPPPPANGWYEAHKRLIENESALEALEESRKFNLETVKAFRLGHVAYGKVGFMHSIPYFRDGKYIYSKLKVMRDGKKVIRREPPGQESWLFNCDQLEGDRRVIVVEGEEDCIALAQAGAKNVVSVPDGCDLGSGTAGWLDVLEKFREVIVAFDRDEKGAEGALKLADRLGRERCRIVEYPDVHDLFVGRSLKDPSEFAVAGKIDLCLEAIRKAPHFKHPLLQLVADDESMEELRSDHEAGDPHGIPTGWSTLDEHIGGIRGGEITIVTGHTGSGKSAFTTALLTQVSASGVPSVGASFELTTLDFRWRIMQRIVGKFPHVRKDGSGAALAMSVAERESGIAVLQEMPLWVVNKFGGLPVQEYIDLIRFAKRRYDCKFFLLDHLHFMTQGSGDKEQFVLKDAIHALKDAARELDVAIWVVCHPSRHARDKATPEATDLHGSASLEQVADNILAVRRLVSEDPHDPPQAQIHMLKLRRGRSGKLGSWTMEFNRAAESMQEVGVGFRPITIHRGVGVVEPEQTSLADF